MPVRLGILTVSDACSRGERSDSSGDLIARWGRGDERAVALYQPVTGDFPLDGHVLG